MLELKKKELKQMVSMGQAIDITNDDSIVKEPLEQIGYCSGIYGISGALLKGCDSGELYAITDRTTKLFKYC